MNQLELSILVETSQTPGISYQDLLARLPLSKNARGDLDVKTGHTVIYMLGVRGLIKIDKYSEHITITDAGEKAMREQ